MKIISFVLGGVVGAIVMWLAIAPQSALTPASSYAPSSWKVRSDGVVNGNTEWRLQFSYPRDFDLHEGEATNLGGAQMQNHPVSVAFPADAYEGTNFGGAWLTYDYSNNTDTCLTVAGYDLTATETINGTTYHVGTTTEGAAGSVYETTLYRTVMNGQCVEFATTVRTGNMGNYAPGAIEEIDTQKVKDIFHEILNTVTYSTRNA